MNWWLWELMKAAGESWQLVPVMNVMLWYFLWVTHKGYGHNHACHVSFAFAGSDTMVSFNVICGFFFTSQRCVLESSFVWTLASASVVDEIHVKVLFPPICVIWVSCCAGQLHQSWSIFWGYILPLVLWSLCMDLASTSCLSSFRLVIHFLDVFCKWTFPSVPPNTFCCILYISSSLFDPCMWTPDYTMELPWLELKLPTWLLCNVVFTFLIAGIAKGGKFSIFSGTSSGQCGVNCFLPRWKIWGFNCEGLHLSPDLWVKPRISAEITELHESVLRC